MYKHVNNPSLLMYPGQIEQPPQAVVQPQQSAPPAHDNDSSKITFKLELINDKLDNLKSLTIATQQNMPTMETSILLSNIQRIVKENEQYKKDLYDKGNKIEEQNAKITKLLMKAQSYVEQNHLMLEQKNSTFQSNSEKNVHRVLELEQDKMRLTGDLSKLTAQISELNLDINRMQKSEAELKQQLIDVSKNTDSHKQTSERLLVENADLQTRLDVCQAEYKKERQLRKTTEAKIGLQDEELNEMRLNLNTNMKQVDEKKRKYESDRVQFDAEIEELKKTHTQEINDLKDKLNKIKSKSSESQQASVKQAEIELTRDWQTKLDKALVQCEQKYERQLSLLEQEKNDLDRQLLDAKELVKTLRSNMSRFEADNDSLKQNIDDLGLIKEKYVRLQSQALLMKERYENRIKELLEQDPDPELIGEEVKKVMNSIYRQLKLQIRPEHYYAGNGVLTAMLKIIKMYTIRAMQQTGDDEDELEKMDFFSQHIYVPEQQVFVQEKPQQLATVENQQEIKIPQV